VNREQFEKLRVRLVAYESQQSASQSEMQQEVKNQVGEVTEGLKALYTTADLAIGTANLAIGAVAMRVNRIEEELIVQREERERRRNERSGGEDRGPKSLLHSKNMKVPVLDKEDGWRSWLADVEDYTEETMPGIGEHLDCAKACGEEVSDIDMTEGAWEQRSMVWRFLKAHTINDARKAVTSTPNRNGWEAWRKLHLQYEPLLVMRGAVTMSHFTSMVNKRARSPAETKTLLLEMDERARRVEEVTGEPIGNNHRMSVVMGLIDQESMRHTAAYGGVNMSAAVLQKKVIEFASLMSTSAKGSDAMDLGRLDGATQGSHSLPPMGRL